jgi:hypothetical protein
MSESKHLLSTPPPRRLIGLALVILVPLACVLFYHSTILRGVAGLLIVNEQHVGSDVEADYVWIRTGDGMSGDGDQCYDWAAKLYERNPRRHILVSVPPPSRLIQTGALPAFQDTSLRELSTRRVPLGAVTTLKGNDHDLWVEAQSLEAWLKEKPNARVLLLSTRFGSRRWSHVLDTVLQGEHRDRVKIWALGDRNCDETNWWQTRSGFKNVFNSYVELAYAWFQGEHGLRWEWRTPDEYERTFLETVEQAE